MMRSWLIMIFAVVATECFAEDDGDCSDAGESIAAGYTVEAVKARLATMSVEAVEGLWQFLPDGSLVAVESADAAVAEGGLARRFTMRVVDSPNREIRPGTLIGVISPGGSGKVFEAKIFTSFVDGKCRMPRKFTLTLNDDSGRMEFHKHRTSIRVNLWHFVPFLWRHSIGLRTDNKNYFPGAVRLYPSPSVPLQPVYL